LGGQQNNGCVNRRGDRDIRASQQQALTALRNNIRKELVFDGGDLIAQPELALFEAFDLQLVDTLRLLKRDDLIVEVAMLGLQAVQKFAEFVVIGPLHQPPTGLS
jgi:hypothetical protein